MVETNPVSFSLEGADPQYHLLGTYTRFSSWTTRAVTILEYFRIPYKAIYIQLHTVKAASKSGLIPILYPLSPSLNKLEINDSLAIAEFLAESHPSLPLWPKDIILRALARSAAAEMHSGFGEVRNSYPTNYVTKYTGKVPVSEKGRKEIERILTIWGEARAVTKRRSEELGVEDAGFLFGEFGIVDAFFWPVLWRFRTYNLPLDTASPEALGWMKTMWSDPKLKALGKDYFKQAENPETTIPQYDDIFKGNADIEYGRFDESWEFSTT